MCGAGRNHRRGVRRESPKFQNDVALLGVERGTLTPAVCKSDSDGGAWYCAVFMHAIGIGFFNRLITMR
jgi:hypothetical protein